MLSAEQVNFVDFGKKVKEEIHSQHRLQGGCKSNNKGLSFLSFHTRDFISDKLLREKSIAYLCEYYF